MTYLKPSNKQSGVTMLLAIFMLTAMVSLAALAGPLINAELQHSYSSMAGEQMLFKAHGNSEYNLFFIQRERADLYAVPSCTASNATVMEGNIPVTNCLTKHYPTPFTLVLPSGVQKDFYFYDVDDPSQDTTNGVTSVNINNIYGGSVIVRFCEFNAVQCFGGFVVSAGSSHNFTTAGTTKMQLQLINQSNSAAGLEIVPQCSTPVSICGVPAGTDILINAAGARRIRTVLP
jgi:hypothetical protein